MAAALPGVQGHQEPAEEASTGKPGWASTTALTEQTIGAEPQATPPISQASTAGQVGTPGGAETVLDESQTLLEEVATLPEDVIEPAQKKPKLEDASNGAGGSPSD